MNRCQQQQQLSRFRQVLTEPWVCRLLRSELGLCPAQPSMAAGRPCPCTARILPGLEMLLCKRNGTAVGDKSLPCTACTR